MLIVGNMIISSEGRCLKEINKDKGSMENSYATRLIDRLQHHERVVIDVRPTNPGHSPGAGHSLNGKGIDKNE